MKPKQPKPVKMWAVVDEKGEIDRAYCSKEKTHDYHRYGYKVIRVTVTPEPTKARDK